MEMTKKDSVLFKPMVRVAEKYVRVMESRWMMRRPKLLYGYFQSIGGF
jgi:hypothetical protein